MVVWCFTRKASWERTSSTAGSAAKAVATTNTLSSAKQPPLILFASTRNTGTGPCGGGETIAFRLWLHNVSKNELNRIEMNNETLSIIFFDWYNETPIHSLGEIEGTVRLKLLSVKNQTSQKDYGYWVVTIVFASPPWGLHSDSIILLVKNVLRVSARFLYP